MATKRNFSRDDEPVRTAKRNGGAKPPKGFSAAPRARWWYPFEGATLRGTVVEVGQRSFRGGDPQPFYVLCTTEDTTDEKGEIPSESTVRVGHRSALSPLADAVGREVWIADEGVAEDGKRRNFLVAFAD